MAPGAAFLDPSPCPQQGHPSEGFSPPVTLTRLQSCETRNAFHQRLWLKTPLRPGSACFGTAMYRISRTIIFMFPPPNLGGKWGCVLQPECSLHLHWGNIMLFVLLNILPHFLLQVFFSYFPLNSRCILWSEKYGALCLLVPVPFLPPSFADRKPTQFLRLSLTPLVSYQLSSTVVSIYTFLTHVITSLCPAPGKIQELPKNTGNRIEIWNWPTHHQESGMWSLRVPSNRWWLNC